MKQRSVIWDLDGTLVDSMGDIGGAMNEALSDLGFPTHNDNDYRLMVGSGVGKLAELSLPENERHRGEELIAHYRQKYQARMTLLTRPYDGIVVLLNSLKTQGVKLAVLSNKRDDFTKQLTQALFEQNLFSCIYGEREGIFRKPDPQAALQIAMELGTPAKHCAFVGDTSVDIQTAKAARMTSIAVDWGFRTRAELLAHSPDYLVGSVPELEVVLNPFLQNLT